MLLIIAEAGNMIATFVPGLIPHLIPEGVTHSTFASYRSRGHKLTSLVVVDI